MRKALFTTVTVATIAACASTGPAPKPVAISSVVDAGPARLVVQRDPACKGFVVGLDDKPVDAFPERESIKEPFRNEKDTCEMADKNIGSAEDAVLAGASASRAPVAAKPWDRRAVPAYMTQIDRRFQLTRDERAMLQRQGFVVSPRLAFSNYAWAYHELYQSQLPLYVSADAILHAVYVSNDKLIEAIETYRVRPLLNQVLAQLHCTLAEAAGTYPEDVARDLDVYLTVARSLMADKPVKSVLGTDAEAAALVAMARAAAKLEGVTLFGRQRHIDFSAFKPRGHYTEALAPFFRAAMWVSRVEFNMVSRASRSSYFSEFPDPSETPREATVGLALADLVERAQAMGAVDLLDETWALLAGKREDISIRELAAIRKRAGVTSITLESAPQIRAAIGNGYQRRARIHPMAPTGTGELPAITTLLGPRIVPDTTATKPLVHDAIPERFMVGDGDMAYALGHDRAKSYTKDANAPGVEEGLTKARAIVNEPLSGSDLYSAWFGAIRSLAKKPEGAVPSFMSTPAWDDLRVNSAIAAYGQIRHNYVLIAAEGYGGAGCEIPDGYVEPAKDVYAGLLSYAERGSRVMTALDPKDTLGTTAYFARLAKALKVLLTISDDELAGRELSAEEKRFVSMVAEYDPPGSGGGPTYTGWYFDLFRDREVDGLMAADFVADYYSDPEDQKVAYAGATGPRLGFFVVDTGGGPRLTVGPVARGYVTTGPMSNRLTDESARAVTDKRDPWAASYTAPPSPEPPLSVRELPYVSASPTGDDYSNHPVSLLVKSTKALGPVTLEMLDHHRAPVAKMTLAVGTRGTKFTFPKRPTNAAGYEAVHVKVGTFDYVYTPFLGAMGPDDCTFVLGGMTPDPAPTP